MNQSSIKYVLILCGVIAPTAATISSRFVGKGVSVSVAATPEMSEASFEFPNGDLDRAVVGWDGISQIPSPFWIDAQVEQSYEIGNTLPRQERPRETGPRELPPVNVSSILPNPKNPLAVIDGKPRRVGDKLDSGWTVMSINGNDFTVTLVHTSGAKIRAGMKKNP
ncbi:MAG: hypothetical protein ACF8MF_07245 [Phycisphaerales bacterium JB052]